MGLNGDTMSSFDFVRRCINMATGQISSIMDTGLTCSPNPTPWLCPEPLPVAITSLLASASCFFCRFIRW